MPHIHEKIDFAVGAFIVHENKVLLVHHIKLGIWAPVGGHVELDEDTDEALFREIEEECGIKKSELTVLAARPKITDQRTRFLYAPNYVDIHTFNETHRHIGLGYFLSSTTDAIRLSDKEHYAIKWFSAEEVEDPLYEITPVMKFYAHEAIKTAKNKEKSRKI